MKGDEESHRELEGVVGGQLFRFGDRTVDRDFGQTEEQYELLMKTNAFSIGD